MDIPKMSPWGRVQSYEVLAEGVIQVHTASHGGMKLDKVRNALIPEYLRAANGWYEEDCAVDIPIFILKLEYGGTEEKRRKSFINQFPDFYERYTGEKVLPGMSYTRDLELFYEEHKGKWETFSAFLERDNKTVICMAVQIPADYDRGPRRYFEVPAEVHLQPTRKYYSLGYTPRLVDDRYKEISKEEFDRRWAASHTQ